MFFNAVDQPPNTFFVGSDSKSFIDSQNAVGTRITLNASLARVASLEWKPNALKSIPLTFFTLLKNKQINIMRLLSTFK